jgi:hypothetical protein
MKKALFLLMLIATATCGFSQHINNIKPTVNIDYVQKSKHQKIAAWILLGGGVILTTAGTAKVISNTNLDPFNGEPLYKANSGDVLILVGTASMVGSIPLFIASSRNKRKAISLSLKNEYSRQIQKGIVACKIVPSLSMKIEL